MGSSHTFVCSAGFSFAKSGSSFARGKYAEKGKEKSVSAPTSCNKTNCSTDTLIFPVISIYIIRQPDVISTGLLRFCQMCIRDSPLYCRMLGASRVTLYFKTNASPKSYSMYLHKKDAAAVADVLLPVRSDTSVFEPTGFERLSFVMLSANIITSSAFALWGVCLLYTSRCV